MIKYKPPPYWIELQIDMIRVCVSYLNVNVHIKYTHIK